MAIRGKGLEWNGCFTYNRDVLAVAEENPQLQKSQGSHPGNGEKANPFDAGGNAETKTSHGKPEPPAQLKRLFRSLLMLIGEAGEGHGSESCSSNQGGIQKNQTGLSKKTVFCRKLG